MTRLYKPPILGHFLKHSYWMLVFQLRLGALDQSLGAPRSHVLLPDLDNSQARRLDQMVPLLLAPFDAGAL